MASHASSRRTRWKAWFLPGSRACGCFSWAQHVSQRPWRLTKALLAFLTHARQAPKIEAKNRYHPRLGELLGLVMRQRLLVAGCCLCSLLQLFRDCWRSAFGRLELHWWAAAALCSNLRSLCALLVSWGWISHGTPQHRVLGCSASVVFC